ncbi:PhzF family phenazine biosynthesis protein [Actinomycetospora termitidis]|uniref:PhzF family phenazine biosynthesis protein n=1 Tax=Actinomycetospora termitidis TaxID=3053470 RepID=A0ABT7M3L3_9PSEU|nr:PhzF family phenazine biosynthesis protein [Actinomycetospora sp. Odt1-22]MDL5155258.1 PhzF family phenazine biosynthesis protein [Actinomycetospora sp. Odt1-22]
MAHQLLVVDAFTSVPFTGNPAAVCLLDDGEGPVDAGWMQDVAAEMNLSETAFVDLSSFPTTGEVGLRWFTPTVEVEICGHATLASAHVLLERGLATAPIAFSTAAGVLRADRAGNGAITLDFPIDTPVAGLPGGYFADEFADALGASVVALARCRYDVLVEVSSAEEVRDLEPDLSALRAASGRGVIVTAANDLPGVDADFVSRFFAPAVGIDEDPVTGSAHCCLAPYWAERTGKPSLVGAQLSRRGGTVGVEVVGDRVMLRGDAVTITEGVLRR